MTKVSSVVDCPECPRELDEYDISEHREGRTDIPRWKRGRLGAQLLNAGWITTEPDVADHIDYIRALIGPEFVGIGSDFDGDPSVVEGLEDVSRYPALLEELARRGWTVDELRLVAGENFLRVLSRAERSAAEAKGGAGAGPGPSRGGRRGLPCTLQLRLARLLSGRPAA